MQTAKSDNRPANLFVFESIIDADHLLQLPAELPEGSTVRITIEPVPQQHSESDTTHHEIVRLLQSARQAYRDSGGKPMNQDEILTDIRTRRGEAVDDYASRLH